jgi:hypothetical protein
MRQPLLICDPGTMMFLITMLSWLIMLIIMYVRLFVKGSARNSEEKVMHGLRCQFVYSFHVPRGFARFVGTAFQGSSGQGCLG